MPLRPPVTRPEAPGTDQVLLTEKSGRVLAARKLLRRSRRSQAGQFLVDGAMGVREALAQPRGTVLDLFCTPAAADRHPKLLDRADQLGIPCYLVNDRAAAALSETVSPQGIIARCARATVSVDVLLAAAPRLLVVLVETADPGNAGTVIRLADAVAADGVIIAGDAVDEYNPKAVRASTGSVFHLPVARAADPTALVHQLHRHGITTVATAGTATNDLFEVATTLGDIPIAVLLGSEAHGLSADIVEAASTTASLPLYGRAESLNLATAAAVALYTLARAQRDGRGRAGTVSSIAIDHQR